MSFSERAICGGKAAIFYGIPAAITAAVLVAGAAGVYVAWNYLPPGLQYVLSFVPHILFWGIVAAVCLFLAFVAVVMIGVKLEDYRDSDQKPLEYLAEMGRDTKAAISQVKPPSGSQYKGWFSRNLDVLLMLVSGSSMIVAGKILFNLADKGDSAFFVSLLLFGYSAPLVGLAIWNRVDKRALPNQKERTRAIFAAFLIGLWLVIGLGVAFNAAGNVPLLMILASVGITFVPVSLAAFYLGDPNGSLTRFLPWHRA